MLTKELKNKFIKMAFNELDHALVSYCAKGDLDVVEYLLTSKELITTADIYTSNNYPLKIACEAGRLDIVKYLLTSKDIESHADISADNDMPLYYAVTENHIDIVQYLCESQELLKHSNFSNNSTLLLNYIVLKDNKDMFAYFYEKYHFDLHQNNDQIFINACKRDKLNIAEYLIFEQNIEKTPKIYAMIEKIPEVATMFKKRDLHTYINNSLHLKKSQHTIKNKI